MSTAETAAGIDPGAVRYLENAVYYSNDPYLSQRKGELYALLGRLEALDPAAHIPTKAIAFICGLSANNHCRFALLEHDPELSTEEKTAMFLTRQSEITDQLGVDQPEISLLKTLTLQVNFRGKPYYFLVFGSGDFRIDPKTKASLRPDICAILGIILKMDSETIQSEAMQNEVMRSMQRTIINPQGFHPATELGLNPGIVSPFADLSRSSGTLPSGLLYLWDQSSQGYTAVAMSETE